MNGGKLGSTPTPITVTPVPDLERTRESSGTSKRRGVERRAGLLALWEASIKRDYSTISFFRLCTNPTTSRCSASGT
jgi:hypothetical protein